MKRQLTTLLFFLCSCVIAQEERLEGPRRFQGTVNVVNGEEGEEPVIKFNSIDVSTGWTNAGVDLDSLTDQELQQGIEITATNSEQYINDSLNATVFREIRRYYDSIASYERIIDYSTVSGGILDLDPRNAVLTDSLVDQVTDGFGINNFISSGSSRPYIIEDYINSRPVIKFDGVDDYLEQSTAASNFNTTDGYTWFFVIFKPTQQSTQTTIMRNRELGTAKPGFAFEYGQNNEGYTNMTLDDGSSFYVYAGGNYTSIRFQIMTAKFAEAGFALFEGLSAKTTTLAQGAPPVGGVSPDLPAIIGRAPDSSRANNFYVARVIGYNRTLTADETNSVIRSLGAEYNLDVDNYVNINDYKWQNAVNLSGSGVTLKRNAFAFFEFNTNAEKLRVNFSADNYAYSSVSAFIRILVNDQVFRDIYNVSDFNPFVVALPKGWKKVTIVENNMTKPSGTPIGTRVGIIDIPSTASWNKIEPEGVTESFCFIGNSITNSSSASDRISQGFATLFRYDAQKNVSVYGWGFGGVYDIVASTTNAGVLADSVNTLLGVSSARKVVVLALGTNDCYVNNGKLTAAAFGELYEAFLDSLIQTISGVEIFCITPIVRTDRTSPNQFGNIMQDYRDAIATAAAGKNEVTVINGPDLMGAQYLADGVHPSTEGHRIIYNRLREIILTKKQSVPSYRGTITYNVTELAEQIKRYALLSGGSFTGPITAPNIYTQNQSDSLDNRAVHLAGAENITGDKGFTGYVYYGDSTVNGAARLSNSGNGLLIEVRVDGTWQESMRIDGDGAIQLTGTQPTLYFGNKENDGTWQIGPQGNDFTFSKQESGSYVTKSTISGS